MSHRLSITLAMLLTTAAVPAWAAPLIYRISTLDPGSPFFTVMPLAINASGRIVGSWTDPSRVDHGFNATQSSFSSFDSPGADANRVIDIAGTWASGLNDAGTEVGGYTAGGAQHGFVRDAAGAITTLDFAGHLNTRLQAINNRGQIVGRSNDSGRALDGTSYLRDPGGALTLVVMPASVYSEAEALDDGGNVAGGYLDAANQLHGFLRLPNGVYTTIDVAGADTTLIDGLNDAGWMVGGYDVQGQGHGFVRDALGQVATLDVPGASFTVALVINAAGLVVGQYCTINDDCHGFLATPDGLAVPEPPAMAATALLLMAVSGACRRVRRPLPGRCAAAVPA